MAGDEARKWCMEGAILRNAYHKVTGKITIDSLEPLTCHPILQEETEHGGMSWFNDDEGTNFDMVMSVLNKMIDSYQSLVEEEG